MKFPNRALLAPALALAFAVFHGSPALGQGRDFAQVQIKDTAVTERIHMLEGAGGNIAVSVGPDGLLIVDDQFAPLAEKIDAALGKIGGERKLQFLVNTHWHGDHTGGNAYFGAKSKVVAHANVRKRLAGAPGTKPEALPVITFEHSASLHFNGEEIELIHLGPGHTDGDSVIFFKDSKVVHMGDLFFNGKFPFVDLGSGGDVASYPKNIAAVLARIPADAKIIPGHGPLATVDDLKKFHEMLVETTGIISQAIAAGKSLADVQKAGLPEKWKDWGTGFINTQRWIEIAYNSLSKK